MSATTFRKHNVLPGFNISLGYTLLYLGLIVLIPLSAAFFKTYELGLEGFWNTVTTPRVIASYNAGPLPVGRWATINDKGDPLLWIESIPYWETRYYVPAVLRNMWVYQGLNHEGTATLKAMAEHRWPSFPTGMTQLNH